MKNRKKEVLKGFIRSMHGCCMHGKDIIEATLGNVLHERKNVDLISYKLTKRNFGSSLGTRVH